MHHPGKWIWSLGSAENPHDAYDAGLDLPSRDAARRGAFKALAAVMRG